ncbi:hypothetical protein E4U09_007144 [Claviceps aff. purpurea]|uniref:PHD-type domain-containing protein n=1 Tax=Claviceps aff. purpurea TaxID=1967640 RepID=A0A9P7QRT2_9HYPO|nr:hypothetical protein E4U09_007144 [Claviceps aff. purpurea]
MARPQPAASSNGDSSYPQYTDQVFVPAHFVVSPLPPASDRASTVIKPSPTPLPSAEPTGATSTAPSTGTSKAASKVTSKATSKTTSKTTSKSASKTTSKTTPKAKSKVKPKVPSKAKSKVTSTVASSVAPTAAPTAAPIESAPVVASTEAPTIEAPTTEAPTTEAPTTEEPTTEAPTTEAPTAASTAASTTAAVTPEVPAAATTPAPAAASTAASTTAAATTPAPAAASTPASTTPAPAAAAASIVAPTTASTPAPTPASTPAPTTAPIPATTPASVATPAATPAVTSTVTSGHPSRKRGTASAVKRGPRKSKAGEARKSRKISKAGSVTPEADDEAASDDDGSDSGPYCLCRGPDDHRWMICCEGCEDWFHGECIKLNKDIGEHLIEKFICPNCTTEELATIYKKTCALNACRKAARLTQSEASAFCSNEHAQTWWERMVSRLPKAKSRKGLDDQLAQEEFMALLNSNLEAIDAAGLWTLAKAPFSDTNAHATNGAKHGESALLGTRRDLPHTASMLTTLASPMTSDGPLFKILSHEENEFLDHTAQARLQLNEETVLCHKMFTLIELAQQRRRAAIDAGHFAEDICGYDSRLDVVSARDVFSAFVHSPEGEEVFRQSMLADPLGEDDAVRGMCDRKRCKAHSGWQKTLALGIKHHIREMADEMAAMEDEENIVRAAAEERWKRRQAESNWVEVLSG